MSFPNALYYINKEEMEHALNTDNPSYKKDQLAFIRNSNQLVLINDEGKINECIKYSKTAAHAAHHLVFWLKENKKIIFFGGDDAPQHQQMKSKFVAKYDFDGRKSMQLREEWWEQGKKEGWTFLFYHDIKSPIIENLQ